MAKESLLPHDVRKYLLQQEGVGASVDWALWDIVSKMRERGDIQSSVSDLEALKVAEDYFREGLEKLS